MPYKLEDIKECKHCGYAVASRPNVFDGSPVLEHLTGGNPRCEPITHAEVA